MVQKHLFSKLKFIVDPRVMNYSESEQSICQFACQRLNVKPEKRQDFWAKFGRYVEKMLCATRSNKTSAMKTGFIGKQNNSISMCSNKIRVATQQTIF